MIRINSLKLNTDYTQSDLEGAVLKKLGIRHDELISVDKVKQSVDARNKADIKYVISVNVKLRHEERVLKKKLSQVSEASCLSYSEPTVKLNKPEALRPVIVGMGPAGLFCGLMLARYGLKPVIIERGRDVDSRIADVNAFWESGKLNDSSNVQFGEGGAGTFSDGKLNTMVHDAYGRISKVFDIFVEHGADPSIKYINKPHIGTDRLSLIVKNIRREIIELGGKVLFESRLTGIEEKNGRISGIVYNDDTAVECDSLVLAIGHSARDTFRMLNSEGIAMENKAFAAGIRVQHPQKLISRAMYGDFADRLPAADYKLTYHTGTTDRAVYSFCMCPGGFVVNASSEQEHLVVNGMSNSGRDEASANSAIVVTVDERDYNKDELFSGMKLQEELEKAAFRLADGAIPVQYLDDFKENRLSPAIRENNPPNTKGKYSPADLNLILPAFIKNSIKEAFEGYGKQISGFDSDDTLLLGVETRTSSPVRIIRNDSLQSLSVEGVFPCGEGAGYAGGITSAAVDGIRVFEAIINRYGEIQNEQT